MTRPAARPEPVPTVIWLASYISLLTNLRRAMGTPGGSLEARMRFPLRSST